MHPKQTPKILTPFINLQSDYGFKRTYGTVRFKKNGGYEDLFNAAESEKFVNDEVVLYSNSLSRMRAIKSGFDFQYEEGREKGIEVGRAQGIEEGRVQGIEIGREEGIAIGTKLMAQNMKKMGYDVESIAAITGLSPDCIREL